MLFYNFESLDDFIQNNLIEGIRNEKHKLQKTIDLYNLKKTNLLAITTNMIEITNTIDKSNSKEFYNTISLLKKSFEDLESITSFTKNFIDSITEIISLHDKDLENNYQTIKAELIEYNKRTDELSNKIFIFENNITTLLNTTIQLSLQTSEKNINIKPVEPTSTLDVSSTINEIEFDENDNNILIISEKEQKAYLPYKYNDVKTIFTENINTYKTMQDVVDDIYTVPLSRFKNSSISRFKEAFTLIRNKEKGSITKGLDLGLELMFKYNLNPVIIAACRNLDELDIYLDCLEEEETSDFDCFEIKFEIAPHLK